MKPALEAPVERPVSRAERMALAALFAFTAVAVAGYGVFGLHPEWLPTNSWATRFYSVSFPFFARLHIGITTVVLGFALWRRGGWRWIGAFASVGTVAFLAEHIGTGYGVPFSGYSYTGLLGPRVGGRVPWLIPISWFVMAAPSYVIARHLLPGGSHTLRRMGLATALLVTWDLALDPAMSFLTPYWLWETPGAFYGMPWVNLLGWAATGFVIMAVLEAWDRAGPAWRLRLSPGWAAAFYLAVLLMPLGMVTAAGLWGSVAATVAALGVLRALHPSPRPGVPSPAAESHGSESRLEAEVVG